MVNAYSFFGLRHFLQAHWFHLACLIPAYFWPIACIASIWTLSPSTTCGAVGCFRVPAVHIQALDIVIRSLWKIVVDLENGVLAITGVDWDVVVIRGKVGARIWVTGGWSRWRIWICSRSAKRQSSVERSGILAGPIALIVSALALL